ncbi:MAG: Lrp/AsnC family transcriptional regulator [Nitrososphaera sp.]|nr:Lrp/AsnC family transcriptional regulator [Candidatus Nitrososphaera gargensis]
MISAIVLVNCRFPFDADVIAELNKLSAVSHVYRTSGIYDLIVKVSADTENSLRRTVCVDIGTIRNVDSTVTMVIA